MRDLPLPSRIWHCTTEDTLFLINEVTGLAFDFDATAEALHAVVLREDDVPSLLLVLPDALRLAASCLH